MKQILKMNYPVIDILEWLVDYYYGTSFSSVDIPLTLIEDLDEQALLDILERFDGYLINREDHAAYFTPNWISELMVGEMLGNSTFENKSILDLACGSGNLLKAYILMACEEGNVCNDILQGVYGVDINEASVRALKLNVYVSLYSEGYDDFDINLMNLYVCDSLIDFNPDFKFDYIIGNPPYIGEKNNTHLFTDIKETAFGKKYYEGKMDYFYFFLYKGYECLKDNGKLVYLTTNYYLKADGAKRLRRFIKRNDALSKLIDFGELKVFKDAKGQHNLITILDKTHGAVVEICHYPNEAFPIDRNKLFYGLYDNVQMFSDSVDYEVLAKIRAKSNNVLGEFFTVNQGIVSGADKLSKKYAPLVNREVGSSIFVLEESEVSFFKDSCAVRFYKNSDIGKYKNNIKSNKYILYNNLSDDSVTDHLYPYKDILVKRREVKSGSREWYELTWPRVKSIFEGEKIVVPQRSMKNTFAYDNGSFYGSADIYYIQKLSLSSLSLKFLLGYLNSSIMYYYLYQAGKRKGEMLELYATPLKELPIMVPCDSVVGTVEEIVEGMIDKGYDLSLQERIDDVFFDYFDLKEEEIDRIKDVFYA